METSKSVDDQDLQPKMEALKTQFIESAKIIKARAQSTLTSKVQLSKLKDECREAEDELVKVLAVKTRKEAKMMAIRDSISATKARIEELKTSLQNQKSVRDDYLTIISQQTLATSEEKEKKDTEHKTDTHEAMMWYSQVLGLQIEAGHGIKFTFTNINSRHPEEEYSFTIRYANKTYTLLTCDPYLSDADELVHELNISNGLFKFVRIMREKFEGAAIHGLLPQSTEIHRGCSVISESGPALTVSTNISASPLEISKHQILHEVTPGSKKKKKQRARRDKLAVLSPGPESTPRRSARILRLSNEDKI